ncbi:hypothetical protein F5877DRAFT_68996 [Lentinula edodes]|nr:hypothetical protein F5877DRAFT_68996 [Lentinula edodes]
MAHKDRAWTIHKAGIWTTERKSAGQSNIHPSTSVPLSKDLRDLNHPNHLLEPLKNLLKGHISCYCTSTGSFQSLVAVPVAPFELQLAPSTLQYKLLIPTLPIRPILTQVLHDLSLSCHFLCYTLNWVVQSWKHPLLVASNECPLKYLSVSHKMEMVEMVEMDLGDCRMTWLSVCVHYKFNWGTGRGWYIQRCVWDSEPWQQNEVIKLK